MHSLRPPPPNFTTPRSGVRLHKHSNAYHSLIVPGAAVSKSLAKTLSPKPDTRLTPGPNRTFTNHIAHRLNLPRELGDTHRDLGAVPQITHPTNEHHLVKPTKIPHQATHPTSQIEHQKVQPPDELNEIPATPHTSSPFPASTKHHEVEMFEPPDDDLESLLAATKRSNITAPVAPPPPAGMSSAKLTPMTAEPAKTPFGKFDFRRF